MYTVLKQLYAGLRFTEILLHDSQLDHYLVARA